MKIVNFYVKGMHCTSCEKIISDEVLDIKGVKDFKVNYSTGKASVSFDSKKIKIKRIFNKIESLGYSCSLKQKKNSFGWVFGVIGILIIAYFIYSYVSGINLPSISENASYGLIFVTGLLTGFHCVGMCGGFVMSYSAKNPGKKSHLFYALGKTVSYTIIGAIFGFIGSIITFTPMMRGVVGIIAGIFLLLYGIQMLNLIPILRRIRFTTPSFIKKFVGDKSKNSTNPLVLGLLNGLMLACGPLQAMYVMAASTGSIIKGASMLLFFGLGTLPVMLGFGMITSFISGKFTNKIVKASAVIVMIMGIFMVNNGLSLTGSGFDFNSIMSSLSINPLTANIIVDNNGFQEIRMNVTRRGWEPDSFVLQKGVPVKWIINGLEINGCNNAISVPDYNLEFDIIRGEQIIEFTPTESGTVSWSCWMGMIPGVFVVTDDVESVDIEQVEIPESTGGCGCGCGGA